METFCFMIAWQLTCVTSIVGPASPFITTGDFLQPDHYVSTWQFYHLDQSAFPDYPGYVLMLMDAAFWAELEETQWELALIDTGPDLDDLEEAKELAVLMAIIQHNQNELIRKWFRLEPVRGPERPPTPLPLPGEPPIKPKPWKPGDPIEFPTEPVPNVPPVWDPDDPWPEPFVSYIEQVSGSELLSDVPPILTERIDIGAYTNIEFDFQQFSQVSPPFNWIRLGSPEHKWGTFEYSLP